MSLNVLLPLIPAPALRTVPLRSSLDAALRVFAGLNRSEQPSDFVDAVDLVFEDNRTQYTVTASGGIIHGIIFNTSIYRAFGLLRSKKVFSLLSRYCEGERWTFFNDDGFGPSWRRSGDYAMAYYSSQCDIMSFNLYKLERRRA